MRSPALCQRSVAREPPGCGVPGPQRHLPKSAFPTVAQRCLITQQRGYRSKNAQDGLSSARRTLQGPLKNGENTRQPAE